MKIEQINEIFGREQQRFIEEWKEFLRFKSVSTEPRHEKDCELCATWLCSHLERIGFKAKLLQTDAKPVVFASYDGPKGNPTVLYYGHYDVQPVDPLNEWRSDPFEPELRDGRVYARGAEDNKGQTFYFIKAAETLIKEKALQCTLKLLIEGEEESGSSGISSALPGWGELVNADTLMVCDTDQAENGLPTITMGLRGLLHLTVRLSGPMRDLHSGVHGGLCKNPATEMGRLIASLHRDDGSIAVDGYYDSVLPIDPEDRRCANAYPFQRENYIGETGVEPLGGEHGFSPAERRGFRPTIEVNGIHSGYGGPGSKTIIPSTAIAKLTARLVGGQDPKQCLALIVNHLKKHAPEGLRFEITEEGIAGPALLLSSKSKTVRKAKKILQTLSSRDPLLWWSGASIPVVSLLSKVSGAEPLLVGFGLEEDCIHAPNESFSLRQFKDGFRYVASFLSSP